VADIKVDLIVPFIKSTHTAFETMMATPLQRKEIYVKRGFKMFGDISGIIGLSGPTTGTCAVSMPGEFARRMVSEMLGEDVPGGVESSTVRDGVGEIINMVTGGAKAKLAKTEHRFDITLPTIIAGYGHEVFHRKGTQCLVVLFETERQEQFTLDLAVRLR
jgi:chemotaxis protein CheX